MLLSAVSDTDKATSPLAIIENILDELPPGEQAISIIPMKNKGSNRNAYPNMNASTGKNSICPISPAMMGRGRWRNSLKSSMRNVSPNSNINSVRMGRTIHIAFIRNYFFLRLQI